MNEALDNLRSEIQTDRIELQRTMQEGFDRIFDKLDGHGDKLTELEGRVSSVENTQRAVKRTVVGAASAVFSAGVAYFFSWIK